MVISIICANAPLADGRIEIRGIFLEGAWDYTLYHNGAPGVHHHINGKGASIFHIHTYTTLHSGVSSVPYS